MSDRIDNFYKEMKELELLTEVAIAGSRWLASQAAFEIHADNPYGDAQVGLDKDILIERISEYNKVRK